MKRNGNGTDRDRLLSAIADTAQESDCAFCRKMEWEKGCPLVGRDDEDDNPFTYAARTADCRGYVTEMTVSAIGRQDRHR